MRLIVRAIDPMSGEQVKQDTVHSNTQNAVLKDVPRAVARMRRALADTIPVSLQMSATDTHSKSAGGCQGIRKCAGFAVERRLRRVIREYKATLALDPHMGRAYPDVAVMAYNSGNRSAAAEEFQQAMATGITLVAD
jgi:hypothetical protein